MLNTWRPNCWRKRSFSLFHKRAFDLTDGRFVNQHVVFLGTVEDARSLTAVEAAFTPQRITVAHQKPHGILLGVNEDLRSPSALFLLEPIVEVLLQSHEGFRCRLFELGDRMCIGLKILEGPGLQKVLLGVLALEKVLVLQVDLNGHVGRGGVRVPIERDAVVLRLLEEDVHNFRRGHLMHKVECVEQALRRVRIRVHEHIDELVIIDAVGGGRRRQRQSSAVEVGLVRFQQSQ